MDQSILPATMVNTTIPNGNALISPPAQSPSTAWRSQLQERGDRFDYCVDKTGGSAPFDKLFEQPDSNTPTSEIRFVDLKKPEYLADIKSLAGEEEVISFLLRRPDDEVVFRVIELTDEHLSPAIVQVLSTEYNLNPDSFLWKAATQEGKVHTVSTANRSRPLLYCPVIGVNDHVPSNFINISRFRHPTAAMFSHNIPPGATNHMRCLFELDLSDDLDNEFPSPIASDENAGSHAKSDKAWIKLRNKLRGQQAPSADTENQLPNSASTSSIAPSTHSSSEDSAFSDLDLSSSYKYNNLDLPPDPDIANRIFLHLNVEEKITTLITFKPTTNQSEIDFKGFIIDAVAAVPWEELVSGLTCPYVDLPMAFLRLAFDELASGWMFALNHYDIMLDAMRDYSTKEPSLISQKLIRLGTRLSNVHDELATTEAFIVALKGMQFRFSTSTITCANETVLCVAKEWDEVLEKLNRCIAKREALDRRTALTNQSLLAQASIRDSNSMRQLAIAATLFLPGAFIAGLFGSNFREVGQKSNFSIWVYFVITVPLTVIVMFLILSRHSQNGVAYCASAYRRWRQKKKKKD